MAVCVIRAGRADEADALIAIEQRASALLHGHAAHDLFAAHTLTAAPLVEAARAGCLCVAQCDGIAVGYALYDELDGAAHLLQMDVDPAHGRRGIGRRLLAAVCAQATQTGFAAITLTTLRDVPWNAPFYASAGFVALSAAQCGPGLRDVLAQERRLGFPMQLRVAMRRALP